MKAKKRLGQHFLKDELVLNQIVSHILKCCDHSTPILEIGPGQGALTYRIKDHYENFKAIELDRDMVDLLKLHLKPAQLIHDDFLNLKPSELFGGEKFNIVGNFPYNISSQIVFRIIDNRNLIPNMVGMFQKEVAERICSSPGGKSNGIISIITQAYYDTTVLMDIGPECFDPPPQVNSSVIHLRRKENIELGCDERLFKQVVKMAFQQRRKKMRNTLKTFNIDSDAEVFQRRPEELGVEEFVTIVKSIQSNQ